MVATYRLSTDVPVLPDFVYSSVEAGYRQVYPHIQRSRRSTDIVLIRKVQTSKNRTLLRCLTETSYNDGISTLNY